MQANDRDPVLGTPEPLHDRASREHRFRILLETTTDLVGIGQPGRLHYLNAAARTFFSVPADADLASVDLADRVPPWTVHVWETAVVPSLHEHGTWSGELEARNAEGTTVPLSVVLVGHAGGDGAIEVTSCIARDISERKAFESQLEHQATHDPLTGLPNRTLLVDRLEVTLGRAARNHLATAVLFLDLDHFKVINDSLGHGYGDQLLTVLAERLTHALRPGDTVARFGGDEFVVLCEDLHSPDEARAIADRIAEAIAVPAKFDDTEIFVTASIGIALAAPDTVPEDLVRDADAAMYEAKERGRARTEVFDSRIRSRAVDRLELEAALRQAVPRHELLLHYQPKVALATGRIIGFEALLRWGHPERGLLGPAEFLPIADDTRLIVPIGHWVMAQACRVLAKVQSLPGGTGLTVSINLSARQLAEPQLAERLRSLAVEAGVEPRTVQVEIAESVLMEDVTTSLAILERMRSTGVSIAVDDFGTGYSSLAYLRRFPVDGLNVDRTFVDGLGSDPGDSAVVAAVVNLAHTLGLRAVAEGVETAEQLAELRRLGCDTAFGFFLSRPVPDADLLDLVASQPLY